MFIENSAAIGQSVKVIKHLIKYSKIKIIYDIRSVIERNAN